MLLLSSLASPMRLSSFLENDGGFLLLEKGRSHLFVDSCGRMWTLFNFVTINFNRDLFGTTRGGHPLP